MADEQSRNQLPRKFVYTYVLRKVKAISLQAWKGPEGSRMLRLPDFKTIST